MHREGVAELDELLLKLGCACGLPRVPLGTGSCLFDLCPAEHIHIHTYMHTSSTAWPAYINTSILDSLLSPCRIAQPLPYPQPACATAPSAVCLCTSPETSAYPVRLPCPALVLPHPALRDLAAAAVIAPHPRQHSEYTHAHLCIHTRTHICASTHTCTRTCTTLWGQPQLMHWS